MKKRIIIIVAVCTAAVITLAGPVKSWSAGETIVSSDINANFQHIHNLMVGGHGARLVNSDVSGSAAIAHSKLATPSLIPKAFGIMSPACDGGTCAWTLQQGFTSTVTRVANGQYDLFFQTTRADAVYAPLISVTDSIGAANHANADCYTATQTTSKFRVLCTDQVQDGGPARYFEDIPFSVTVFDNN